MYGSHPQQMNIPRQIATGRDDAGASGEYGDDVSMDEIPHHGSMYVHGGAGTQIVGHEDSDLVAQPADGPDLAVARPLEASSQLTLSFRGQVYVFDTVTTDKVEAALSLLGGCTELSSGSQGVELAQQSPMPVIDYHSRSNLPHRAISLDRFRKKKKDRCFDKKVRYSVRQEVALRMQRNKGQFTSSKRNEGADNGGQEQDMEQDDGQLETSCTHCGTSSKCTPMMRRGPLGPRTLCNACGLFWANRGTLRDLSKKTEDNSLITTKQADGNTDVKDLDHPAQSAIR